MINTQLTEELLSIPLSHGADFTELYWEETRNGGITLLSNQIESISDNTVTGVGIRAFKGTATVYGSTSDLTETGLRKLAGSVAEAIGDLTEGKSVQLRHVGVKDIHPVRIDPASVDVKERCDLLRLASEGARAYDPRISQAVCNLITVDHTIGIANSEGLLISDRHLRTRMAVQAVATEGTETQSGRCSPGRGMGLEVFEMFPPESIGKTAAEQAITNLKADYCPAGQMTVAIENGFGGVIFHEACGHSLEATSVGKMGTQIANPKVTAIDDGTIPNAWGSVNIDDEGNPTARNVLIEGGVLKKYMVDRLGSRRLGMPMTGNSRRESYLYEPTSRMTNTFIDNGPDKNEDIIASIEYGLYAKSMGGGSVNPLTGAFNFAVTEGYIVRNGKICEPVRGASLVGTGKDILMDIDMVGQNLDVGQGMCGSSSGSVPTDVGQPLIRVSKITVGGRK